MAMTDEARCEGILPMQVICPWRRGCIHYQQTDGPLDYPTVDSRGNCYDRLTTLGQQLSLPANG